MLDEMVADGIGTPAPEGRDAAGGRGLSGSARATTRRSVAVAVVVLAVASLVALGWRYLPGFYAWLVDPGAVHAYVAEHAVLSRLAIGGANVLQITLAFLPGEPIELASGYAFGFWEGSLVCLVASGLASTLIFWSVRRWGWRVVGLFFDRSHLERYAWLRDSRRLEFAMFVIFLIPGTPKDFLTYFAGLTDMRFGAVLAITTLGRIPSIVTSTVAASAFGAGDYLAMGIAIAVSIALILVGGVACRRFESRERAAS